MQKLTKKTKADLDDQLEDIIFFSSMSKNASERDNNKERYYYWEKNFYAALIRLYNDYGLMPWANSIEGAQREFEFYDGLHKRVKPAKKKRSFTMALPLI